MNVSKWLKIRSLLDVSELKELLFGLTLYNVSEVLDTPDAAVCSKDFFKAYETYVDSLKAGTPLIDRRLFSSALSKEPIPVQELGQNRYIAKPNHPVIQMQPHAFIFSDGKCLSMVHGLDSVSWGLQFAYPQIAMDDAGNLEKTLRTTENGTLFLQMQKWMREKTRPTSFTVDGQKINTAIRLGKKWTGRRPYD